MPSPTPTSTLPAPLPVELAFVVELAAPTPGAPLQGCVEHVLSGRRVDFAGTAELLAALRGPLERQA
jgi:hypothetical protein